MWTYDPTQTTRLADNAVSVTFVGEAGAKKTLPLASDTPTVAWFKRAIAQIGAQLNARDAVFAQILATPDVKALSDDPTPEVSALTVAMQAMNAAELKKRIEALGDALDPKHATALIANADASVAAVEAKAGG